VPIYDYVCASCRQKTEVIHGIDAPGPRFCPACGAEGTMRKTFAAPTVHFKGSGWAKKDRSSSTGSRTRAAAAGGDSGEGSSKAGESAGSSAGGTDGGSDSKGGGDTDAGGGTGGGPRGTDKTTTKGAGGSSRSDEG